MSRWNAAGAAALSGRPDGPPLPPPAGFLTRLHDLSDSIHRCSAAIGRPVSVDPSTVLAERAAISHFGRRGAVSCGGATHLLRSADEWMGVTLARPDDWELVPAWFELDHQVDGGDWEVVAAEVMRRSAVELSERSRLLGLPVAVLGERRGRHAGGPVRPVASMRVGEAPGSVAIEHLVVVDLSSLWAGPLATSILADAGARVIKVESSTRPDGARRGPEEFFDRLNGTKRIVAFDFGTVDGRASLRRLVDGADIVVTSSRQRAIDQLGLPLDELVGCGRPRIWLSITGYGRIGEGADRVAFGDDAAIAGGLVVSDDAGPCCFVDAVADPCTGLAGAAAVLRALELGGRWILDAAMADIAAHLAAG